MTPREDVDFVVTERDDSGAPLAVRLLPDPAAFQRFALAVVTGDPRHLDRDRPPGDLID